MAPRRCKIRRTVRKSRDRNRVAMEDLMVHDRVTAARRADLVRRGKTVGRANTALQTDLNQRSNT
jgi:hypothetical protein